MDLGQTFLIGRIVKAHGVKGKLEMAYTDDVFMRADIDYLFFKLDGLLVPFFLDSCTLKGNDRVLLKLDDIDNEKDAKPLMDAEVYFPKSEIPEREEDFDSWEYLTGYAVYDAQEGYVGEIVSMDTQSTNTILFVKREDNTEVMIPLHPDLVTHVDETKRQIDMALPEGLLSLNDK